MTVEVQNSTYQFTENILAEMRELVSHYPEERGKSALIPILHIAQKNNDGWLSVPVMDAVADFLQIQPIEVYEVATFYSMFNMKPVGKYVLEVCRTGPCMLRGSEKILNHIRTTLQIKDGETTPDGMFTLKPAECLGACGYAPMLQLGKFYHENLDIKKVDEIIAQCKSGNIQID